MKSIILKRGQKYKKSIPQVIFKWINKRGIVSLTKSVHETRIKDESFELNEEYMKAIESLDTETSTFFLYQDLSIIKWFGDLIIRRRK